MLKGNQAIFVYGDPTSTLATLEELKEYMGGGDVGGVTKEYVDAELAKKIGLPATANEGDILTFTGGKWTAVAASQPV
ncbi:putative tail fiber protein [Acinetobacter phage TAC1]|nr:putative tail fiber protein [Acinetobacter phage TAC1]